MRAWVGLPIGIPGKARKSCAVKAFSFLVICHKAVYNKDSYRYAFENKYLQGSEMEAGVYDIADA